MINRRFLICSLCRSRSNRWFIIYRTLYKWHFNHVPEAFTEFNIISRTYPIYNGFIKFNCKIICIPSRISLHLIFIILFLCRNNQRFQCGNRYSCSCLFKSMIQLMSLFIRCANQSNSFITWIDFKCTSYRCYSRMNRNTQSSLIIC